MPITTRDLIVLSDGTSNSASKPFKTNVWRLYQALNLRDGSQVAVFGDGVGNSSIKFLRVIGLALGFGVKRNVHNLYKFLCHNYREADLEQKRDADRIWMFGFSRGAFTVRVLAGLIDSQGLVTFKTESELNQNAIAAYRAYRAEAFKTKIPWVRAGRAIRDKLIHLWRKATGGKQYDKDSNRKVRIHFMGVWDTVAAYGLPIDELTIAVDKWVWPMKFDKTDLLLSVDNARQACGLDDERRTFHPIPWSEDAEKKIQKEQEERVARGEERTVPDHRLLQVWFPGMHADVGGGYPDDGLSLVPLCWMIDEAAAKGLNFEEEILKTYRAQASPTGRLYDSRAGGGVLWRYQPRNVQLLMDDRRDNVSPDKTIMPTVHHCAITRMTYGNDGYAPISLPLNFNILLPDNSSVAFDEGDVERRLDKTKQDLAAAKDDEVLKHKETVLTDLQALMRRKDDWPRSDYFDLVLDTVWLRRCVYFVTLGLVLIALVYPVIYQALGWDDNSTKGNQIASGTLTYFAGLVKGVLPAFVTPWVDAATRSGPWAIAIVLGFVFSLALSSFLQFRIHDRARGAWNIQPETGGDKINRLKLTGQRRGLATMTFLFLAAALVSLAVVDEHPYRVIWFGIFAAATVASAIVWRRRVKKPEDDVNPSHPRWALSYARKLRKNPDLVKAYRWVAQTGGPAFFIIIVAWLAIGGLNLGLFNLQSTAGKFCLPNVDYAEATSKLIAAGRYEKLGTKENIDLTSLCAPTGLWLIAGSEYRIQVEQTEPWFDRTWPADVIGFTPGWRHTLFTPLKRWWLKNWFQPIVRVGNIGNYEYPLFPTSPLPKVDFKACKPKSPPRTKEAMDIQLKCEKDNGIVRNKVLIADITPNSTGELYFYVNDAVLAIPFLHDRFYRNNIGKAKVTVTRTIAPATIDFRPE